MIFVSVRSLFTPSLQKGNHTRAYESLMLRTHYFSSKKVLGSRASSVATKNHIKIIFYYFLYFLYITYIVIQIAFFQRLNYTWGWLVKEYFVVNKSRNKHWKPIFCGLESKLFFHTMWNKLRIVDTFVNVYRDTELSGHFLWDWMKQVRVSFV